MIVRGRFTGSIRELSGHQLQQLRQAALYRGLDGVAQAIKREQLRRLTRRDDEPHRDFRQEYA